MESNNTGLEQEIAQIEQALASKREALRQQQEAGLISEIPHEKEVLREVVHEKISTDGGAGTTTAAPTDDATTPTPQSHTTSSPLSPAQIQTVQDLVNTAFNKSIDDAVKEAKATNNAALIDAFHDLLVDELYDHLVERGKLHRF